MRYIGLFLAIFFLAAGVGSAQVNTVKAPASRAANTPAVNAPPVTQAAPAAEAPKATFVSETRTTTTQKVRKHQGLRRHHRHHRRHLASRSRLDMDYGAAPVRTIRAPEDTEWGHKWRHTTATQTIAPDALSDVRRKDKWLDRNNDFIPDRD